MGNACMEGRRVLVKSRRAGGGGWMALFRVICLVHLSLAAVVVWAGDYDEGLAAAARNDYGKAMQLWRRAADAGHGGSRAMLGMLYENGLGVPKSDEQAAKWYRLAVEQDQTVALFNLAIMYDEGRGVPQDAVRARALSHRAAELGYPPAQVSMAERYLDGRGVMPNKEVAYMWFSLAESRERVDIELRTEARKGREEAASSMTPQELAEARDLVDAWLPGLGPLKAHELSGDARSIALFGARLCKAVALDQSYPEKARAKGWAGTVQVLVTFGPDGRISDVSVARSSGRYVLDDEAVRKIERLQRVPAPPEKHRGKNFSVVIPIVFSLFDEE